MSWVRGKGRHYKRVGKYRSPFEARLAAAMEKAGVSFEYETLKLKFTQPAKDRTYHPDFILPNGIILEAKGEFTAEDRKKMMLVREQHPHLDIRMVFTRAQSRIYPGSPTTNAAWCEEHGIKWADKTIPLSWLKEPKGK